MDRRNFNKLLAATMTVAGIPRGDATTTKSEHAAKTPLPFSPLEVAVPELPAGGGSAWELVILDAAPAHMTETGGTAAGDIDGDGKTEVIVIGNGSVLWYRPSTAEKGVVALGRFGVGVALEDIDGDGKKEIVLGKGVRSAPTAPEVWTLCWYKMGTTMDDPWKEYTLDSELPGSPHDVIFGDVDGDGRRELISNAMYCEHPGLFAYKIPSDPRGPWIRKMVQTGLSAEGTAAGDLDGDGKEELVSGPYWFSAPRAGAFSEEPWIVHSLAPDYREMCRAAIVDVNGDGHLDVVLVEDEYPDGRLAWFENPLHTNSKESWVEHPIDAPLNFSHSLRAWRDPKTKTIHVLAGEMNAGGWRTPYNWNARLIKYTAVENGNAWQSEVLYRGEGTHEAVYTDLDGSGNYVIFGHSAQVIAEKDNYTGWVQMFRPRHESSAITRFKHGFIDREKPYTGVDIIAADVDGDGLLDIVCGAWWYKNPTWERHPIPGVAQIINAYDVDNDGRKELIGFKGKHGANNFYDALSSNLVWLKPTDLTKDLWEEHVIGSGDGDWPHGNTIAPLLPGGRVALVCGYHDHTNSPPQIFEVPVDPTQPWPKRILADIPYGEEMVAYDLDGDGKLDIVAGPFWLENLGDGRFESHLLIEEGALNAENQHAISRIAIMDINGNGRPDILFTVENVDWNNEVRKAWFAPVGWLENTGSPRDRKFKVHYLDQIRSPHSISVADLDGDGELEVIVGEHDPFNPYRSQCRLLVYKKADPKGLTWTRIPLDNRFEHHDGAKAVELSPGHPAIISHGWMEPSYVHIWEPRKS